MNVGIKKSLVDEHTENLHQSLLGSNKDDHSHHSHSEQQQIDYQYSPELNSIKTNQELYQASLKKLWTVSFVSIFFIACQLFGGYYANSIAIYTDTAHLASDLIGFAMSIVALKITMNPASKELTYGWHRAEIIGTMISVIFLIAITFWLLVEASNRVINPQKIDAFTMIITAVAGLFFNFIQMSILHQGDGHYHIGGGHHDHHGHDHGHGHSHDHDHGHDHKHDNEHKHKQDHINSHSIEDKAHKHQHNEEEKGHDCDHEHDHEHKNEKATKNINVDAAYLHVLGDMIMSIGVCIAAVIIYFYPDYKIADPICTFIFSIIVCVTVWPVIKNCINILMEGSPSEINVEQLLTEIHKIEKGVSVHDFHFWSLSMGKYALSAHVTCEKDPMYVLQKITNLCKNKFNIDHVTIQMEDRSVEQYLMECQQISNNQIGNGKK